MRPRNVCSLLGLPVRLLRYASSLCLSSLLATAAIAADTGTIAGTVTSNESRNALQGAVVTIPATKTTVLTDNTGSFLIQSVPAGPVDVEISYSGFATSTERVVVGAGQTSQVAFKLKTSDLVTMSAFTVETVREGQALSITEQRNAGNIKNVSALDEWGNLPTMSVGELASRLPGISFTIDEDNVINNVSIRGMPSGYTRLNIDGMSATGVGGDGRTATLHSFSGAMYEEIEVIAGQTPDKRADSLGGQLNLKTRSPLSMAERRRFNYNIGTRWSAPWSDRSQQRKDHPLHPISSFSYMERFDVLGGQNNLGISVNASYSEVVNMLVYDSFFYQTTTDPTVTPAFVDYTTQAGQDDRFITGISLRADYRLSPRSKFSFNFLYNAGSEPFYDRVKIDPLGNSTVGTTGSASILPGFTENHTDLRQTGTNGTTRMDLDMWRFSFTSKNPTGTFTGEHDLGALKLDYAARWSNTHWDSGAGRERQGGELTMRADNIGFSLDKTDPNGQVFKQTQGPLVTLPTSYTTNIQFTKRDTDTDTNEVSATFNASYKLATEIPITFKTGLDTVNRRVNNRNVAPRRWNRNTDTAAPAGSVAGAQIPLIGYAAMVITPFEEKNGVRLPTLDPVAVSKDLNDTSKWTEDLVYASQQPYTSRRIMEEGVDATYLQGQTKLGRLTAIGGVRFENVQVNTFNYVKLFSTTTTAEPDPFKRAAIDYRPHSTKGHYDKFFPSLHLSYDLSPNLKLRASYSQTYGRPALANLVPTLTFSDTAQTVTAGNPSLKPQVAKNYDVKVEYYTKNSGIVSFGVFEKKITDYILSVVSADKIPFGADNGFEGNFGGYTLTAPVNAGSADVKGWEFDYRQRLSFLPGLFKGLGIATNYTWLQTTGKFTGIADIQKNDVAGFIPRTGNARLTYAYKAFGASFGLNYTSKHLSGAGVEPVSPLTPVPARLYRTDLTTVSAGVSYKVSQAVSVNLDVNNISQKGPVGYRYTPSRLRIVYTPDVTVNFGVSGQF